MEAITDSWEPDPADTPAPREAHRLYISATDMDAARNGATAIASPSLWIEPLLAGLPSLEWKSSDGTNSTALTEKSAAQILENPGEQIALVGGHSESRSELVVAAARLERRMGMIHLIELLNEGAEIILLREPAFHGFDWTVYSANPLSKRFRSEWIQNGPYDNVRAFTLPWKRARGEHRFHFEHWALDDPQDWMEEIV